MEIRAEKVNPYAGDSRHKGEQVRDMFDSIAPAYDFMNRAMTLGIDTQWRRKAVQMIADDAANRQRRYDILDVATGTGDLAISMARRMPTAVIRGIDLSSEMISIGRDKVSAAGMSDRIAFETGDCLALPFGDCQFDCVSVAFGVRNFERLVDGYREMWRVLRPGGMLCVIELSTPTAPVVKQLYNIYTRHVIPAIGRIVSKDSSAYSYLPASIAAVPQRGDMTALIREAGFAESSYRLLTFGVCSIYYGRKAAD